jgi:hypothetical protein
MASSSAVGSSLSVGSGNVGGRISGRVSIARSLGSHVKGDFTSFTTTGRSGRGTMASGEKDERSVGLNVFALLDPATESAQKLAPLLVLLRDRLGATVTVQVRGLGFLGPLFLVFFVNLGVSCLLQLLPSSGGGAGNQEQLPLRSFYRFVMPPDDNDEDVASSLRPHATLVGLPGSSLLTMQLSVPEPWNVQAASAPVDLDNMRVGNSGSSPLRVRFWLRDLLVAGQCSDRTASAATARGGGPPTPNGLQLQLLSSSNDVVSDTLVMQNLQYWCVYPLGVVKSDC